MQAKVAAYITCYQDQASSNRCIQAIESQSVPVHKIYIVDNSQQPLSLQSHSNLLLVNHYPDNIGIAEGLAKALQWAIAEGYDFLWTFDQDSIPTPNCLEILLDNYDQLSTKNNYRLGIIAPTPSDPRTGTVIKAVVFNHDHFLGCEHNYQVDFYECDSPITSGSLISLAAAKTVAPPVVDLFIDGIDFDYGLRFKHRGFHNIIVTKAIMYHNLGNPTKVKFFHQERFIQKYSALRNYYICRNHTYLETRLSQGYYRLTSLIRRFKYMMISILLIILYDSQDQALKIWACVLGTYHGLIGKLGKNW